MRCKSVYKKCKTSAWCTNFVIKLLKMNIICYRNWCERGIGRQKGMLGQVNNCISIAHVVFQLHVVLARETWLQEQTVAAFV